MNVAQFLCGTIMLRKLLARHPLLVLVLSLSIACYLFVPQAIDSLGPAADQSQNRCQPKQHPPSPERDDPGNPDGRDRPNPGAVKVIQLTNEGSFVNRCQLTDALYEINWDVPKLYGPRAKDGAKNLPRLIVLYVHGWQHSASREDGDRRAFEDLIRKLQQSHEGSKQVLGIYVGWNASNGLGVLDYLSFWAKQRVADRIAQSGAVTKIVAAIGSMRQQTNERMDQFIAIGHSFGARILFSATNQVLVNDTARAHPGRPMEEYKVIPSVADSVILLNPAFEASLFTALSSYARFEERFANNQSPLLVSVSTDNDWATRTAFPVGQWLAMRRTRQEMTTIGNDPHYQTHTLARLADGARCPPKGVAITSLTEHFSAAGLCLSRNQPYYVDKEKESAANVHNPFLSVGTTSAVIDGHNGIWGGVFGDWLFAFVKALEIAHRGNLQGGQP